MKEKSFKNRFEVFKHLKAQGLKVSKDKIYQAVERGFLKCNLDGTVPHSAVKAYVNDPLNGLAVEADQDLKDLATQKLEKELEKLCEQVSALKFQRERAEGLHIKISEYEAEIASRAAVFEAMLKQSNEAVADKLILKAGVKPSRRQLIVDLLNEALMDALAAYVAQDEIIGEVMGDDGESFSEMDE